MIKVREANEEDNQALIELQTRCPQGTNLILNVDSSPDFFARSRPFKDWSVLVAVDDGRIVGSAGYAVSDTLVEGRSVKMAYEYGFMVDPQERRKGIAAKLQECIEHDAIEKKVDLLSLTIIEDNLPSMSLFSKMGFRKARDCATFSIMVYKKQKLTREANIRSIEERDFPEVVNLINEMYHGYDLFHPLSVEDLLDHARSMLGFDLRNVFVFEDNQGMKACLGYWDYTKVRKYIVEKFSSRLRAQLFLLRFAGLFAEMPRIPKLGEPLVGYTLTLLSFKDTESITDLIKHVINIALERRISLLHIPMDLENPAAEILSRFRHTRVDLQFLAKPLSDSKFPHFGENKLFIDATEI